MVDRFVKIVTGQLALAAARSVFVTLPDEKAPARVRAMCIRSAVTDSNRRPTDEDSKPARSGTRRHRIWPLAFETTGFPKRQKVDIRSADSANFGAMPVQLALQPMNGYLRFEVTGVRVRGEFAREMLGVWQRVADECQAGGFTKALGISNVSGPVPLVELYEVGERTPQILAKAGCRRVAYVVLGGKEAFDALKFGEDVAVNRGQAARIFADESAAVAWLMEP